jgi:hypothetical protein
MSQLGSMRREALKGIMSGKERALDELQKQLLDKYGAEVSAIVQQEVKGLRSKDKLGTGDIDAVELRLREQTGRLSATLGKLSFNVPRLSMGSLKSAGRLSVRSKVQRITDSAERPQLKRPSSLSSQALRNGKYFSPKKQDSWGKVIQRDSNLYNEEQRQRKQRQAERREDYRSYLEKQMQARIIRDHTTKLKDFGLDLHQTSRAEEINRLRSEEDLKTKDSGLKDWRAAMQESLRRSERKAQEVKLERQLEHEDVFRSTMQWEADRQRKQAEVKQSAMQIKAELLETIEDKRLKAADDKRRQREESIRLIELYDQQEQERDIKRLAELTRSVEPKSSGLGASPKKYTDVMKECEVRAEYESKVLAKDYQATHLARTQRLKETLEAQSATLRKQEAEKRLKDSLYYEMQREQGVIWKEEDAAYLASEEAKARRAAEERLRALKQLKAQIAENEERKWAACEFTVREKQLNRRLFKKLGL